MRSALSTDQEVGGGGKHEDKVVAYLVSVKDVKLLPELVHQQACFLHVRVDLTLLKDNHGLEHFNLFLTVLYVVVHLW